MPSFIRLAPLMVAGAAVAITFPATVLAQPDLPYGPNTCIDGFVWREANSSDQVCVTPDMRTRIKQQNASPKANKEPNGGDYGPETCKQGFVWREAFDGDTICVSPEFRSQVKADNAAKQSRYARNQKTDPTPKPKPASGNVVLEITGTGTVYSVDIDPGGRVVTENGSVPYKKTISAPSGSLVQIIAVPKTGSMGCRITIDGRVLDTKSKNNAHCTATVP